MNIGEFSIRRTAGACAATAIKAAVAGLLLAGTAAAQPWDVSDAITGSVATPVPNNSPWSFHQKSGTGCAVSGPQLLLPASAYPTQVRGVTGNLMPSGPLPLVWGGHNNAISPTKAAVSLPGGTAIPINGVLMHPHGGQGECVAVRFAPGAGTYNLTGRFYGAYANMGIGLGNGVLPKILKNGNIPIGPTLNATANTASQNFTNVPVTLGPGPGEFVDFAIYNNNSNYQFDSTILELRATAVAVIMPAHGVTAVPTAGPVNACAPFKLCFDVNVPNNAVGNGQGTFTLQITQNGFPVSTPSVPPITTGQDGQICFQVPALPAGLGYDYILNSTYTYFPNGQPPVNDTIYPPLFSPIQGPNNDLVCNGPAASTCCPPLEGKDQTASLFYSGSVVNGPFPMDPVSTQTSPAWAALATSTNAYLNYLKVICPTVATIKTTFTASTATAMGPTGMPITTQGTPFTGTYTGIASSGLPSASGFNAMFNQDVNYVIIANTQAYNAQGQVVQCGFNAAACNKLDRFTINIPSIQGIIVSPGTGTGNPKAALPAGQGSARTFRIDG